MKIFAFLFVSIVILWKYGEVSTKKDVLRMTRVFLTEYKKYQKYFLEKDTNPAKHLFKYQGEQITITLSSKVTIVFSSFRQMRRQFKNKGGVLLNLLEFVEEEESEEYIQLDMALIEIRRSILACGEIL